MGWFGDFMFSLVAPSRSDYSKFHLAMADDYDEWPTKTLRRIANSSSVDASSRRDAKTALRIREQGLAQETWGAYRNYMSR